MSYFSGPDRIHFRRDAEYIRKNWRAITSDAKKESKYYGCGIFAALFRTTGHDLHTDGNAEIMSVGKNRLVVGLYGKLVGTPKAKGKQTEGDVYS